jgi:RNA polymerase sigma-70 factor (ECF subfamily)
MKRTRAACSGDAQAFGELVTAHHRTVAGIAYAITGTHSAIDDLVQDTFLVAWKNLEELRVPEQFSAWLSTIARNLSKNWIRSEVYRRALKKAYSAETPIDSPSRADESLQRSEQYETLFQMLESVASPLREVLVLYYLEEMTVKEISAILNISGSNARKRLERGRTQMRQLTENEFKLRLTAEAKADPSVKQNVLASLTMGPALPLAEYAATGSIAAIPTSTALTSSQPFLQTLTKGIITMSTKKLIISAMALLLITLGLVTFNSGAFREDNTTSETVETPAVAARQDGEVAPDATASKAQAPDDAEIIEAEPSQAESGTASPVESPAADTETQPDDDEASLSKISGTVYDEWDAPVPNAEVVIMFAHTDEIASPLGRSTSQYKEMGNPENQYSTVTNNAGRYVISGEFQNMVGFINARIDGASGDKRIVVDPAESLENVNLTIKVGIPLIGQILTANQEPIAGAYVTNIAFMTNNDSMWGGRMASATTNEMGVFQLIYREKGMTSLHVVSTEGQAMFHRVPVGGPDTIPLQIPLTGSLTGIISYADGAPAENIWVTLDSNYTVRSGGSSASGVLDGVYGAVTQADGSYEISDIASMLPYDVTLTEAKQEPTDVARTLSPRTDLGEMAPGEKKRWDFTIQNPMRVIGTVRGQPSGLPLAGVHVMTSLENSTTTKADGTFVLEANLEPGTYRIYPRYTHMPSRIASDQYAEEFLLEPGKETEISLVMPDPGRIRMVTVDQRGEPIANVSISPNYRVEKSSWGFGDLGKTNEDGVFEWSAMPPNGTIQFNFRADGYSSRQSGGFQGRSGADYGEEVFVLFRNAGIEGYATVANGDPLAFVKLNGRVYFDGHQSLSFSTTTAEDGYFIVKEEVPATTIQVEVSLPRDPDQPKTTWRSDSFELEEDTIASLGVIQLLEKEE